VSTDTPSVEPLFERESARAHHVGDLVLLVLTTADDALDFETLVPRVVSLVEDERAFGAVETTTAAEDVFDALELFTEIGYAATATDAPTAELTDRGEKAAKALVAGLDPEGQAALTEVTANGE
jgi:hypothetical protein